MLALLPILMPLITEVLGKILPDPAAAAAAQLELSKALIAREGDIDKAVADAAKAQSDVNLEEAKSASLFVAGWRPFIGWACGVGFVYATLLQPILAWISAMAGITAPPLVESSILMSTLGGMLGLGTMRTVEKIQGVANTAITPVGKISSALSGIAKPFLRRTQ